MDIKQAIVALNTSGLKVSGRVGRFIEFQEALKCAISAMKELQLYKDGKLCLVPEDVYARQCEELDAYKQLGTLEECTAAVEKQDPKKVEIWNGQAMCPNCRSLFGSMSDIRKLIAWDMPHCKFCGQAIDWTEVEE